MKRKKGTVTRLRLYEGDLEIAQAIANALRLELIDVLTICCAAGLAAIRKHPGKIDLPLELEVKTSGAKIQYPSSREDPELVRIEDAPKKRKAS